MGSDARARWLLLLIFAGVGFLVVRDLLHAGSGRYAVNPLRAGSPLLIRTDTQTGESWRLDLRAGGGRWLPLAEPGTPEWNAFLDAASAVPQELVPGAEVPAQPLARDEIKALANAILGDELSPDIRFWAVGQLAATEDRRATLALIQLLGEVDDPRLVALIREALSQRDDPRARRALERSPATGAEPRS